MLQTPNYKNMDSNLKSSNLLNINLFYSNILNKYSKLALVILTFTFFVYSNFLHAQSKSSKDKNKTTKQEVVKENKNNSNNEIIENENEVIEIIDYRKVTKLAKEFLDLFQKKEFSKAHTYFDENVKNLMSIDALGQAFNQIETNYGKLDSIGEIGNSSTEGLKIVEIVLHYPKTMLNYRFAFDTDDKIAGLFFIPTYPRSNTSDVKYIDTTRFTEEDVEFGNPDWTIKGSLCIPKFKKSMYAVVMLSGSGPNNRNSEIGPNAPFLDIAQGLATNGIMTIRFDKRTKIYGKRMIMDSTSKITLEEEYYQDADYAIDFLKRYSEYLKVNLKGIIILGHSQGGMVAPYILNNSKYKNMISGAILMAAPARPFEDMIYEQIEYIFKLDNLLDEKETKELEKLSASIKKVKDLENNKTATDLPMGLDYHYWKSLSQNNFNENLSKIDKPIFVLQGGKDYQVTAEDLNIIETILKDKINQKESKFKIKFYENLNHCFMKSEGTPTPDMYMQKNNVNEDVIKDLSTWIKKAFTE